MSFWQTQPLSLVSQSQGPSEILEASALLEKINQEIEKSPIKLDYKVYTGTELQESLDFINKNYVRSDTTKLTYSMDLFRYFVQDSLLIHFYPKDKHTLVATIVGKKQVLTLFGKTVNTVDVNFLCLEPKLRSLHLAPYLIATLTKETVQRLNINLANYTVGSPIKAPCFGTKTMYHRPAHIKNLIANKYIPGPESNYIKYTYVPRLTPVYLNKTTTDLTILSTKVNDYNKLFYDIYEQKPLSQIINNPAFHLFSFDNNADLLVFYCLESQNTQTSLSYRNGYLYLKMLSSHSTEHIKTLFDSVAAYCYRHNILDMITLTDIFDLDYQKINFVQGTGKLNFHLFNMNMVNIQNHRNGLTTI